MFRQEITDLLQPIEEDIPHPFELGSARLSPGDFGGRSWGAEAAEVEPLLPGPQKPYQNRPYRS